MTEFPARHLSIRVPWSDVGWDGRICVNPLANHACLALKRISENRNDQAEERLAGTQWSELSIDMLPPCAEEHGAFMSPLPYKRVFTHPYTDFEPGYELFRPTSFVHPAYTAACTPYAWALREKSKAGPRACLSRGAHCMAIAFWCLSSSGSS